MKRLAALTLLALLAAGCGGSSPEASGTGTSTGPSSTTVQQLGVKFAECVRAHDVPHFPDPDPDGDFTFGVDVTPEVWRAAVEACKDLQPPGSLSSDRTPAQQSAALKFADCVREHGVIDFPDPVEGEPLINTYKIPSSDREGGMAILNAAIKACGDRLDEAARAK